MIPITVQAPGLADRNLLQKPGGFIWWYLDLVEENGDGFVLIFAWGLPFLPGLLHAARQGKPQMPGEWPAVSLAVYRGGTCVFYLLDVPETASWDQTRTRESLAFGRSTMTLGWESGRFELQVNLDTEGAGEPISGQICVTGPGVQSETAPTAHSWAVLAACVSGQATLKIAGEQWLFSGRAYVDRNAGDRPIDTLGKLMGGFWSDVSKKSTGVKRTALDQARMTLLQQMLAAELNASAFGSALPSGSFAAMEAAYCGTNQTTIKNAQQQAASFNSSGDTAAFTPGTSADSKNARAVANYVFWNVLP